MYSNRNKILIGIGAALTIGFLILAISIVNKPINNLNNKLDTGKVYDELLKQPEIIQEVEQTNEIKEESVSYKTVTLDNLGLSLKIPEDEYLESSSNEIDTIIDNCYISIYRVIKPDNMAYDRENVLKLLGITDSEIYNSRDSLQDVYRERYFSDTNPNKWSGTTIINNERVNIKDIIDDNKIKDYERDNIDINDIDLSFDGSMDYTKTTIKDKNTEAKDTENNTEVQEEQLSNTEIEPVENNEQELVESSTQDPQNNTTVNLSDLIDEYSGKYVYKLSYIESILDDAGAYILSKDGQLALLDTGNDIIIVKVLSDNGSNAVNIDRIIDSLKIVE